MMRFLKIGLFLLATGCSLLSFETKCPVGFEDVANCFYQAGLASFEKKNYVNAIAFFRKVSPTSDEYQNSLRMIERVPVERAKNAIASGNYQQALIELKNVEDYFHNKKEAEQLQLQIQYFILKDQLSQATLTQVQIDIIKKMIPLLALFKTNQHALELLGTLKALLQRSTVPKESQQLIELLDQMVKRFNSPELTLVIQRIAFATIERFQNDRQIRNALLNLIRITKLKLQ